MKHWHMMGKRFRLSEYAIARGVRCPNGSDRGTIVGESRDGKNWWVIFDKCSPLTREAYGKRNIEPEGLTP